MRRLQYATDVKVPWENILTFQQPIPTIFFIYFLKTIYTAIENGLNYILSLKKILIEEESRKLPMIMTYVSDGT